MRTVISFVIFMAIWAGGCFFVETIVENYPGRVWSSTAFVMMAGYWVAMFGLLISDKFK